MICHLYKITNKLTNEFYIGKRKGDTQNNYWGSGLRIKRQIQKYGRENFTYDILRVNEEDIIFKLEKRLVTENYIKSNEKCLNLAPGGKGGSGLMNKDYMRGENNPSKRPEVRKKLKKLMSENHPMVILSKTKNGMLGKKHTNKTKEKISNIVKKLYQNGYVNPKKGKTMTFEQKKNMFGPRPNISGKNNPFFGKTHSEKVINSIREGVSREYSFVSPQNKVFKGRNLVQFCKDMNLAYFSMHLVKKGKQENYKGWRAA